MIEIAYLAILSIPLMVAIAFARFGIQMGISLSMICAVMFLPEYPFFDLPYLPRLDRQTLTLFCVALLAYFMDRRKAFRRDEDLPGVKRWIPQTTFARIIIVCALLYPVGTWLTNQDGLGDPYFDPGMDFVDYGWMTYKILFILLAVAIGRRFLYDPAGTRAVVVAVALAGVLYAVLTALEWRLAPFLSSTIYGQSNINWIGIRRWGVFRPQVFQSLGLLSASLMMVSMLAALVMMRYGSLGGGAGGRNDRQQLWTIVAGCGVVGWVFAWSLGGWLIGLCLGVVIVIASLRLQSYVITALAIGLVAYPLMRTTGTFPADSLVSFASMIDQYRANSLNFRFEQEAVLMERTARRPWFGWGIGDRAFVLNDQGNSIAITDSLYIIVYMQNGFAGIIGHYGLAVTPLLMLAWYRSRIRLDGMTTGLALMIIAVLVDSLLNATMVLARWIMVGALIGRIEYELALRKEAVKRAGAPTAARDPHGTAIEPAQQPTLFPPRGARPAMAHAPDRTPGMLTARPLRSR